MKRIISLLLICALLLICTACSEKQGASTNSDPEPSTEAPTVEDTQPESGGLHHVSIEIADYGTITLELDGDQAPITVANFLKLAGSGFYDGLTFHRIIAGYMMQGGDPEGTGYGGSEENIVGEFSANGHENKISHVRGTISMARADAFDSASSQFFITHANATFLDGQYAAFGHVTEGMEVVDAVCEAAQPVDKNGTIPSDQQPVITTVTVID